MGKVGVIHIVSEAKLTVQQGGVVQANPDGDRRKSILTGSGRCRRPREKEYTFLASLGYAVSFSRLAYMSVSNCIFEKYSESGCSRWGRICGFFTSPLSSRSSKLKKVFVIRSSNCVPQHFMTSS